MEGQEKERYIPKPLLPGKTGQFQQSSAPRSSRNPIHNKRSPIPLEVPGREGSETSFGLTCVFWISFRLQSSWIDDPREGTLQPGSVAAPFFPGDGPHCVCARACCMFIFPFFSVPHSRLFSVVTFPHYLLCTTASVSLSVRDTHDSLTFSNSAFFFVLSLAADPSECEAIKYVEGESFLEVFDFVLPFVRLKKSH